MTTKSPRLRFAQAVLNHRGWVALGVFLLLILCLRPVTDNVFLQVTPALVAGLAVWQGNRLAAFYRRAWLSAARGAQKRGSTPVLVAVSMTFCGLVLWGLVNNLVDPQYGASKFDYVPVLAAAAVTGLLLPAIYGAVDTVAGLLSRSRALRTVLLCTFFIAFFAVQVRIGYALRIPPGWDAQMVLDSAADLARDPAATLNEFYFSTFSNNLALTLGLAGYFKAAMLFGATDLIFAAVVLNCAALTVGALLTYLVALRVGNQSIALFTLIPSTIFLLLSPWIAVAYSDTLGLLFPIFLLYLYLLQAGLDHPLKRAPIQLAMGITAVVGYNIKPTIIFVLIAVALVAGTALLSSKTSRRKLTAAVTGTLIVAGSYTAGSYALTSAMNASAAVPFDLRTNDQLFPAAHYLKMGAQRNDAGPYNPWYGAWSGPDVNETLSFTPEERTERNFQIYLDRVEEMGPQGYTAFLSAKLIWILGDGSFFMWGEGVVAGKPFLADDPLSREIQSYFGFEQENYGTLINLWQTAWIVLLALTALPLFLARRSLFADPATMMRVALLGLFIFLLLFEARSRYLYLYLPFFIILASLSASAISPRRRPRSGARRSVASQPAVTEEHRDRPAPNHPGEEPARADAAVVPAGTGGSGSKGPEEQR